MGKQNQYDHSVRVPWMIVGPDVVKGKTIESPIYLQDAMATSFDLAGIEKPDHVEFKSVLPLLKGKSKSSYDAIYGAYLANQRAVTYEGHKLILYPKAKVARLYNLRSDPLEITDIAAKPESKPIMKKLFAKLAELQKSLDDKVDLAAAFPDFAG